MIVLIYEMEQFKLKVGRRFPTNGEIIFVCYWAQQFFFSERSLSFNNLR